MEEYYTTVPSISSSDANANDPAFQSGGQNLGNLNTLSVGFGTQVLRSDKSGFWLGAATFALAPFSVSMAGVITSKSSVSSTVMTIDGVNGRMLWNDGTNNRIVIGLV
jgi:hypothetical protein